MERPEILTKIELTSQLKRKENLITHIPAPENSGYVMFEDDLSLNWKGSEAIEPGDLFSWEFEIEVVAYAGKQEDHDKDINETVLEATLAFEYYFTVLETVSKTEIESAKWLFYLMTKPIISTKGRDLFRNTPVANVGFHYLTALPTD